MQVESRIEQVTLYARGALVRRVTTIALRLGPIARPDRRLAGRCDRRHRTGLGRGERARHRAPRRAGRPGQRRCSGQAAAARREVEDALRGPVDLVMASGYVGRTEIGFVAANEKLAVGFGPVELPPLGRRAVTLVYRVKSQRGVAGV